MSQKIVFDTPQFDARYPNNDQTKACWQYYIDYQKCIKLKSEEHPACVRFFKAVNSMCPSGWIEKWDTQISEGRFPVDL